MKQKSPEELLEENPEFAIAMVVSIMKRQGIETIRITAADMMEAMHFGLHILSDKPDYMDVTVVTNPVAPPVEDSSSYLDASKPDKKRMN